MGSAMEYDPRYLAGVCLFNRRDFFEAHEVWEDIWRDGPAGERRFYQGLIQAAVALYHGLRGNWRGARRLFHSGRNYMSAFPARYLGLAIAPFWQDMARCLAALLGEGEPAAGVAVDVAALPRIELVPPPLTWPDPHAARLRP